MFQGYLKSLPTVNLKPKMVGWPWAVCTFHTNLIWGGLGFRGITPAIKNQMEKKKDDEMETGIVEWFMCMIGFPEALSSWKLAFSIRR